MKKILFVLSLACLTSFSAADDCVDSIFSRIYKEKVWGQGEDGEGSSGPGSVFENAKEYISFLKGFLSSRSCTSVVDIGCGDWGLSKHINWDGIHYYGYDVVESVINKNTSKYGSKNIEFFCEDGIYSDTPPADLLICKDVLEHLPNDMILDFIDKLDSYKYCLITNDIDSSDTNPINQDCKVGGSRPLNLMLEPFNLKATPVLTFSCAGRTKQVLLVSAKNSS